MNRLIFGILLGSLALNSFSQKNDFSTLDLAFDYFSNTNTFGQFNQITKQPSYSPSLSYFHKSGFNASIISNVVGNSDTALENPTYEYDFMVGYYYTFANYFTIFPSYIHYFYPNKTSTLLSSFTDNFSIDFSADYKNLYSGVSINYLLGNSNEWFITTYLSYTFDFESIVGNSDYLMVQPELNFNFGNQTYYSNYILDRLQSDEDYRSELLSDRTILHDYRILRELYPDATEFELFSLLFAQYTEQNDEFNLSSIGLSFPVAYMIGNFTINASFSTYFLMNKPNYVDEDFQTYFSFGLGYSFMWKR